MVFCRCYFRGLLYSLALLACICIPARSNAAPTDEGPVVCQDGFKKVQEIWLFELGESRHFFDQGDFIDVETERLRVSLIVQATWLAIDKLQAQFEAMLFPHCIQPDCTVSITITGVSPEDPEDPLRQQLVCTRDAEYIECSAVASAIVLQCRRETAPGWLEHSWDDLGIMDELDLQPHPSSSSSSSSSGAVFEDSTTSSSATSSTAEDLGGESSNSLSGAEFSDSSSYSSSSSGDSTSSSAEFSSSFSESFEAP